jgi:hypothetical protein
MYGKKVAKIPSLKYYKNIRFVIDKSTISSHSAITNDLLNKKFIYFQNGYSNKHETT